MANTFIFDDDEEEQQPNMELPQDDELPEEDGDEEEEGEGSNRNFLIIAAVLGGIVLLSLICMAIVTFLFILPGQENAKATQDFMNAEGTQMAIVGEMTAAAEAFTPTPLPTETPTLEPSPTPPVIFATETSTGEAAVDPATATVQALETRLAAVNQTATAQATSGLTPTGAVGAGTPSATALSQTGFADEVGLPGLFILALILVAVILLARRLRQTPLAH